MPVCYICKKPLDYEKDAVVFTDHGGAHMNCSPDVVQVKVINSLLYGKFGQPDRDRHNVQECAREAVKILDALYRQYGHMRNTETVVHIDTKLMIELYQGSEFLQTFVRLVNLTEGN